MIHQIYGIILKTYVLRILYFTFIDTLRFNHLAIISHACNDQSYFFLYLYGNAQTTVKKSFSSI